MSPHAEIEQAIEFPHDQKYNETPVAVDVDAALFAARVVMADLTDRRGIRQEIEAIGIDDQMAIAPELAVIIRQGLGVKTWVELADEVLVNLKDRSGVGQAFETIDDDIMEEIRDTIAELIDQGVRHFAAHGAELAPT